MPELIRVAHLREGQLDSLVFRLPLALKAL